MALSRVGVASGDGATITIPSGHRVGDIIIIFAFRSASTTNPTIPGTFTTITNTSDGSISSISVGYRIATSNAETSGTWTNANGLICHVYRGQFSATSASPVGTFSAGAANINPVNYAARALANSNVAGSSWWVAFAAIATTTSTIETPPTGLALQTNTVGTTCEYAGFDSNGPATGDWPSTDVTISAVTVWQTIIFELKAQGIGMNNFQFATSFVPNGGSGNTGILAFGERIR